MSNYNTKDSESENNDAEYDRGNDDEKICDFSNDDGDNSDGENDVDNNDDESNRNNRDDNESDGDNSDGENDVDNNDDESNGNNRDDNESDGDNNDGENDVDNNDDESNGNNRDDNESDGDNSDGENDVDNSDDENVGDNSDDNESVTANYSNETMISICRLNIKQPKKNVLKKIDDQLNGAENFQITKYDSYENDKFIVQKYTICNNKERIKGNEDATYGLLQVFIVKKSGDEFISDKKENQRVSVYLILKSGFSGIWQLFKDMKDYEFPKLFAETYLSENISSAEIDYFTGKLSGVIKKTYSAKDAFNPYDIMKNYGIIGKCKAPIDIESDKGKRLIECKVPSKSQVKIQISQVKLNVCGQNFEGLIDEIENTLYSAESSTQPSNNNWNVFRYIQKVPCNIVKKMREHAKSDLKQLYENQHASTQSSIEPTSLLRHSFEDSFYDNNITLFYKGKQLKWNGGKTLCGSQVTVTEIIDALRQKKPKEVDFGEIFVQFYDFVTGEYIEVNILRIITFQKIIEEDNKTYSCFQLKKIIYKVELDTYLNTALSFVNIVKEVMKVEVDTTLNILPWNVICKNKNAVPYFEIEHLFQDVIVGENDASKDEIKKKLLELLENKLYALLENDQNNIVNGDENYDEIFSTHEHDLQLLKMNLIILENTTLGKCIGKKKFGKAEIHLKNPNEKLLKKAFNEIFKKIVNEPNQDKSAAASDDGEKKTEKLIKELKKKQFHIVKKNEKQYTVQNPYLTKSLLNEILKINKKYKDASVCPVKLVQFLRRHTLNSEREYNELYHLENCHQTKWKYIVGDRILSAKTRNIELFDVMAVNQDMKTAYFLHVKKGFNADSARDLCSQVSVCGRQLWEALTANWKNNILERFYEYSTTDKKSIHSQLTKKEVVEEFESKEKFIRCFSTMKCFVCFSPCMPKTKSFKSLKQADLFYSFTEKDLLPSNKDESLPTNCLPDLKELGILNDNNSITSNFFRAKDTFVKEMREKEWKKNDSETIYNNMRSKVYGNTDELSLLDEVSSFVAMVSFIDLFQTFSAFIINEKRRIDLKIIEIPRLKCLRQEEQRRKKKRNKDSDDIGKTESPPKNPKQQHITGYFKRK